MHLGLAIPLSAVANFFTGGVTYIFVREKSEFVNVVKIILKNMNKPLWDKGRIAMCHHKLVNCSSLPNVCLLHYHNIQQQIKFKGVEDSAQMFFWTSQTMQFSYTLCLYV